MSLDAYPKPSLAVDLVLMTVHDGAMRSLILRRPEGGWALPGAIMHIDESLEETAKRALNNKVGLADAFLEQLYTFARPDRDTRGRVVSVAYFALVPAEKLEDVVAGRNDLALASVALNNDSAQVVDPDGEPVTLAFDHHEILAVAVQRLRGKIDYSAVGLELLPERFPLRALQSVHEAILGTRLAKPAFRRKMLDRGIVKPTGELEPVGAFRPAELYRRA